MNLKILIAGAAVAALAAGGASAATHKKVHKIHHTAPKVEAYAAPDQPIQYDQLGAYLASHGAKGGADDMAAPSSDKMAKPHAKMHHHHMKKGPMAAPGGATPAAPAATPDTGTPPH